MRSASQSPVLVPMIMPAIIGTSRSPVPSGLVPSTLWKYWGRTNSSPNNAKGAIVACTVPQTNCGLVNRPSSISGWLLRRSQPMKAAKRASPARTGAHVPACPQPCWPALMNP